MPPSKRATVAVNAPTILTFELKSSGAMPAIVVDNCNTQTTAFGTIVQLEASVLPTALSLPAGQPTHEVRTVSVFVHEVPVQRLPEWYFPAGQVIVVHKEHVTVSVEPLPSQLLPDKK